MRIALLAPFEESVPPQKYGGTELVVANIAETLVAMGHQVYLLATGDSKTKAHLIPTFAESIRKNPLAQNTEVREAFKYMGIAQVVDTLIHLNVDIIHNHIGWRFLPFTHLFKAPTVTTLHGPLDVPYQQIVYGAFPKEPYVSISNEQRKPFLALQYVDTVYNGIDISQFTFFPSPGKYLAFLGRFSPEKGPQVAIEVAKRSGIKLKMAGKVDAVDQAYFKKEIEPYIDGTTVEFLDEIGPAQKNEFLGNAYALLAPIQWREPFGLFMIEAMACGTPVIATRMGSAPEIVSNGDTGFVVENQTDAFVAAVKQIPTISRARCREHVQAHFTQEIMTKHYLSVYEQVIRQS